MVSALSSTSAISTDLKRIQTPHSLFWDFGADKTSQAAVGMGLRYMISVTQNEAKNEAGCYQNHIASHFNLAAGLCLAVISQF